MSLWRGLAALFRPDLIFFWIFFFWNFTPFSGLCVPASLSTFFLPGESLLARFEVLIVDHEVLIVDHEALIVDHDRS